MDGSTVIDKSLFKLSCFSREEENKMKEMSKGEKKGEEKNEVYVQNNPFVEKTMVRIVLISKYLSN